MYEPSSTVHQSFSTVPVSKMPHFFQGVEQLLSGTLICNLVVMRSVLWIENGCWYCPLSTVLSGDSSERLLASLLWPPGLPCGGLDFKQFVPCPCRTKLTENRAEFAGSSRQMAHGTPSRQPQLLVSCRLTAVLARGKLLMPLLGDMASIVHPYAFGFSGAWC